MSDDKPDTKLPRIHVLCFDGTADEYDTTNTNVVKFFSLLKKNNCDQQSCYYQAGIGTFFPPGMVSPLFQWCAKVLDEAFAWYLNAHVMDGYRFLMQNYRDGDKICLFGFSRGAYTARALAGMLYKVGLLPRDNQEQIPFAYKLYVQEDAVGKELCAGFKKTYCQSVRVEFLGVWETVASVGIVATKTLPFTNSNSSIKTFRHALSLDEHRARFKPNLFHRESPGEPDVMEGFKRNSISDYFRKKLHLNGRRSKYSSKAESQYPPTDVLEVWFSGCHSDVGGGSVGNTTKQSLANIPLRWMVEQVMASQCGILFSDEALWELNIPVNSVPSGQPPLSPSSQESSPNPGSGSTDSDAGDEWQNLDKVDAVQPLHDQLVLDKLWWIVEVLPLMSTWQDAKGVWHTKYRWNLGRGRYIDAERPYFHVTVKERIADAALSYKPKAKWREGSQVYID